MKGFLLTRERAKLPRRDILVGLTAAPLVFLTPCMHKLKPALLHALKEQRLRDMTHLVKV